MMGKDQDHFGRSGLEPSGRRGPEQTGRDRAGREADDRERRPRGMKGAYDSAPHPSVIGARRRSQSERGSR